MSKGYRKYVHFGTSTWAYEGWKGIVYFKEYPKYRFKKDCLAEYAADDRFSTVGIDLFYYQPPTEPLLEHYASQLPADFKTCSKVWEEITIYRFPQKHHHHEMKEKLNPNFLNDKIFMNTILKPHRNVFMEHTGPFIFEFSYIKKNDMTVTEFANKLDQFFIKLPTDFQYSVEIRNKNFLVPEYFEVLRKHNVAHVFNQWSYMPPVGSQLKLDSVTADFMVARMLTPSGMAYNETVKKFSPYDKIVEEQPAARQDMLKLIELSIKEKKYAYLLINNRLEGCAPLTIESMEKMAEERF
ncbi:DUF72 domain-containing protein [candidate division KSB1 bacterium]|nr:DUF72 domain-containing protein [candidate division KSB1 bacterium]